MKRYILAPEAKQDLADIKRYLTREAGGACRKVYDKEDQGRHCVSR